MPDTSENTFGSKKVNNNDNNDHNNNNNDGHTSNIPSTVIIRYSKDTLLSLHDSPLVCKPENMPQLSSWFGEEAGSPAVSKNMLNGSAVSRSTDKSIVLGPSKTNFASSLYGGLKHTTESNGGTTSGTSKSTSRLRQSEDSIRTPNGNHNGNSSNNRMPRGQAYVGEKGFHHYSGHHHHHHQTRHEKTGLERRTSNPFGNQSSSQNKRFNQSDHQGERQPANSSTGGGRREFNRDQRTGNRISHSSHNDMNRNGQDRVPEWMDYNPSDTAKITDTDEKLESHGDFANDLEAWKSSMKKKEGLDNAPQTSIEESLPPTQTNDNAGKDSMSKILDLGSLDLTSSTTLENTTASSVTSIFNSSTTPLDLPTKRGSRFAKFFAKREEVSQGSTTSPLAYEEHSTNHSQPKSININDLFQTSGADGDLPSAEMGSDQVFARNGPPTTSQDVPPNVRMLSEEDLLQSMGAKKSVSSPEQANQNAIGFNKVLQILSQPKPTAAGSPSSDTNATSSPKTTNSVQNIEKQQLEYNSGTTAEKAAPSPVYSPNVNNQRPALNTEIASSPPVSHTQPSTPTTKPKNVSHLFGGNLPTSVLRQMSARSEGRSPSLSSNKSGHSGRFSHTTPNSQNGSPLNGHASPSSIHLPSSTTIQQAAHSSPIQAYHGFPIHTATEAQANATHLHHSLEGSRPMMNNNDMMMMNAAHATRNRYDNSNRMAPPPPHMFHQNGELGMPQPPSLHHQGDGMNRMMSPPSTFNQQSQQQQQQQQALGDRAYMSPHHYHHPPMPPPSMMGMPGQHPMMSPHLPMRPANGLPPPPPFMHQPLPPLMPGMPPPPQSLGMGMPQHVYTNKTQGWNSQQ